MWVREQDHPILMHNEDRVVVIVHQSVMSLFPLAYTGDCSAQLSIHVYSYRWSSSHPKCDGSFNCPHLQYVVSTSKWYDAVSTLVSPGDCYTQAVVHEYHFRWSCSNPECDVPYICPKLHYTLCILKWDAAVTHLRSPGIAVPKRLIHVYHLGWSCSHPECVGSFMYPNLHYPVCTSKWYDLVHNSHHLWLLYPRDPFMCIMWDEQVTTLNVWGHSITHTYNMLFVHQNGMILFTTHIALIALPKRSIHLFHLGWSCSHP